MRVTLTKAITIFVASALFVGCGSDDEGNQPAPIVPACPPENVIGGQCAGVPLTAVCNETTCPEAGTCTSSVVVKNDADVAAALPTAMPGTCILAEPGTYGDVVLPPGVHLIGRFANEVSFNKVTASGTGPVVRGISVKAGLVMAAGTSNGRIDAVRAEGGNAAITLEGGSGVEIVRSEAINSAGYGVSAFGAAAVSVDLTIIGANQGPGMWAECDDPCACPIPVDVDVTTTIVRDNKYVGIALAGANAVLNTVDVRDNDVGDDFEPGGGLSVAECSTLDAKGLRVIDNTYFGVLVDSSSATFGGPAPEEAVEVSRNLRGIWIQGSGMSPQMSVKLENCQLQENAGVAVGLDGDAVGVIIFGTEIMNTTDVDLPVKVGGVSAGLEKVGDGLAWLGGAKAEIDGLTIGGSARQPFLIDNEVGAGSTIANVTLQAGDDAKGIVIQNLPNGGVQPTVSSAPMPMVTSAEQFSVPDSLGVPMP